EAMRRKPRGPPRTRHASLDHHHHFRRLPAEPAVGRPEAPEGGHGTTGATFVRFGFGLPFAVLYVFLLNRLADFPFPHPNPAFLGWMGVGALSQIGATFLLIHLFSFRNFPVGTAYSRTEPAQAAVFGL